MEYIGIDVHERENQICIVAERGQVLIERVRTSCERFAELPWPRPPASIEGTPRDVRIAPCSLLGCGCF